MTRLQLARGLKATEWSIEVMPKNTVKTTLSIEGQVALSQKRADEKRKAVDDVLKRFSCLPDEAYVRLPVVTALFAFSAASAWRAARNGTIPAPRKFGERVTAWNVGELRATLAGQGGCQD